MMKFKRVTSSPGVSLKIRKCLCCIFSKVFPAMDFLLKLKFPLLAVHYFSMQRESVAALQLWEFIPIANLDYL